MTPKPPPAPPRRLPPTRAQVVIGGLTLFYAGFLFWLWDAIVAGPERSWFVNASLYIPQFFWAIPCLMLFLAAIYTRTKATGRRNLWVGGTLLPMLIVFGPLMGLRGFPSPAQPIVKLSGKPLKVMTYNIGQGKNLPGFLGIIRQEEPDVLLVQELGGQAEAMLHSWFPDWNRKSNGEFLIASRFPISQFERIELPKLVDDPWKRPAYVRVVAQLDDKTEVAIYNTHLSTPRPALAAMKERKVGSTADLESNSSTRMYQAHQLAEALRKEKLPYVLGGDFNAPEPSMACRQIFLAHARNAFSEAGKGYGYTSGHALRFGMSFVRIDHIFVSKHWAVEECQPGDKSGSDHRPMIATLKLANTESE